MTSKEVCEAFVLGGCDEANINKNLYIKHGTLYSHGAHWPLALRREGNVYVNCERYSNTTSRHRGLLIVALKGREYIGATRDQMLQLDRGLPIGSDVEEVKTGG